MARKKVRKISLDEMARKYKPSAVEGAGHEAESRKVHDTLAYMTKTLENGEPGNLKTGDAPARNGARRSRDESHVLCDGCGRPHWRNEMFVVSGRAYKDGCVPDSEMVRAGSREPYWFEYYRDGVPMAPVEPMAPVTAEEVAGYPTESLLWWVHQPSCDLTVVTAELGKRDVAVSEQDSESEREMTPSARAVSAWWKEN